MWYTEFGGIFHSEEEAREACIEDMTEEDFAEFFSYHVNYDKLLDWAKKQEKFFCDFEDTISKVEEEYASEFCHYYEE